MMIGIITSRNVSKAFTEHLYARALRTKQIPLLRGTLPKATKRMKVKDFMAEEVVTIPSVCDMQNIEKCFETTHEGWPVLNVAGNLCGIIPKSVLVTLLQKKHFYKKTEGAMDLITGANGTSPIVPFFGSKD